MISIQGLLAKDLKEKGMLPSKFNDLALEETIPRNPIIDSCFLYLDAINNTGSGHNANYKSGNYVAWKNLCGSKQVIKSNYDSSYTDNQPVIYNDSILLGYTGNWKKFFRCFNRDVPNIGQSYRNTVEVVLTVPGNSKGFGIYGMSSQQAIYFLANREFCHMSFKRNSGSSYTYNESTFSFSSIPVGTRIYIVTRFDNGKLTVDVPSRNLHFEKNSIPYNWDTTSSSSNIGRGAAMSNRINEVFFEPSYVSSLRVHTRVLTNSEVYLNYKYEANRYNIQEIK